MTRTIPSPAPGRRPVRGETPSTRAVVSVTVASVVIAGCLYSGTELVLALLGRRPLIAAPSDVVRQVNQMAPAIALPVILVVAVVGTVLVLVVWASARRSDQKIDSEAATVVVDEEVVVGEVVAAVSERRVTPEPSLVPSRFTAAKAIADAIAYDALRASRASTAGHPTTDPTILTHPIEKKERTI